MREIPLKQKWQHAFQRVNFKKAMGCNGLAKLRGRFKRNNLSNRAEASRINLFIFLSKPNLRGLLVFLN